MLHAILKGKIRGLFDEAEEGSNWRNSYRKYEDFLTASVIGRMAYLPDDVFLRIIKKSSLNDEFPEKFGDFDMIDFWPKWEMPRSKSTKSQYREPDAFIRFEHIDMIVEAKRDDSESQYLRQWVEQILSFLYKRDKEGSERNPIVYWVIGGMGSTVTYQDIRSKKNDLVSEVRKHYPNVQISLSITPWGNLLNTILGLRKFLLEEINRNSELIRTNERRNILRITNDIVESFRLHGFREWCFLEELTKYWSRGMLSMVSFEYYQRNLTSVSEGRRFSRISWEALKNQESSFEYAISSKWMRGRYG